IGARLELRQKPDDVDYRFDVIRDRRGEEYFELTGSRLDDLGVQHVDKRSRHILLYGKDRRDPGVVPSAAKPRGGRFLCGHDERHWFVAGIGDPVTTVRDAKLSLAPAAIRDAVARERHRDRRHNRVFTRQGEWFFVPATLPAIKGTLSIYPHE